MNRNFQSLANQLDPFAALGSAFGAVPVNNIFDIPSKRGQGVVKKFADGNGLTMITWNVRLEHTLHIKRSSQESLGQKNYSLFFILTPGHFIISSSGKDCIPRQDSKTILLISNDVELVFTIKPQLPVRVIEIDITGHWLAKEYSNSNQSSSPFLTNMVMQDEPVLFTESVPLSSYQSIMDLYKNIATGYSDPFYVRAKILSLLSDIFIQPAKQQVAAADNNNMQIHEKMIEVERIMDSYLYKTLPSLSCIARQMALSESTLKRNFKLLYGISIYEYYLRKKMEKARQLFNETDTTVKEVAYMMGYEKVSNFIEIFKKHYHFSPGQLNKTLGAQNSRE